MTDPRVIRLIMELRQGGVVDLDVLSAIERVPREMFLPPEIANRAYENTALPIGHGQTISQPLIVALMCQVLEPQKMTKVLEIGTGSGYQTAILSHLFRRVYTVERLRPLLQSAEQVLRKLNVTNFTHRLGDGYAGWAEQKPFERIIVSAVAPEIPPQLTDQLAEGGIMVIPIGHDGGAQHVVKITKMNGNISTEQLWPVQFVPLLPEIGAA